MKHVLGELPGRPEVEVEVGTVEYYALQSVEGGEGIDPWKCTPAVRMRMQQMVQSSLTWQASVESLREALHEQRAETAALRDKLREWLLHEYGTEGDDVVDEVLAHFELKPREVEHVVDLRVRITEPAERSAEIDEFGRDLVAEHVRAHLQRQLQGRVVVEQITNRVAVAEGVAERMGELAASMSDEDDAKEAADLSEHVDAMVANAIATSGPLPRELFTGETTAHTNTSTDADLRDEHVD